MFYCSTFVSLKVTFQPPILSVYLSSNFDYILSVGAMLVERVG